MLEPTAIWAITGRCRDVTEEALSASLVDFYVNLARPSKLLEPAIFLHKERETCLFTDPYISIITWVSRNWGEQQVDECRYLPVF